MNKQELKSKKTKNKLCAAYLKLLRTKNINQITIREITGNAGYNRGTFYIYYRDIYDLHDKIKDDFLTKIETSVNLLLVDNNTINFETIFKTIANFFTQNEEILSTLIIKDTELSNNIKIKMKPLLKKIFAKDLTNNKIDYVIEYHLSSLFGVITFWILNNKNISRDELFSLIENIIRKGVFNVMVEL